MTDQELVDRAVAIVVEMRRLEAELAATLAHVKATKAFKAAGFETFRAFHNAQLKLAPTVVNELVRIQEVTESLPLIRDAFGEGRLPRAKVGCIVRVATAANEESWLSRATQLSGRALAEEVTAALGERPRNRFQVVVVGEGATELRRAVDEVRAESDKPITNADAIVILARVGRGTRTVRTRSGTRGLGSRFLQFLSDAAELPARAARAHRRVAVPAGPPGPGQGQ